MVTLKEINSLLKTGLVCLFVISCGQPSGIQKNGDDYFRSEKTVFTAEGKLPKTITEDSRVIPVQDKGLEEAIKVEPISQERINFIEGVKDNLDSDLTPTEDEVSGQQSEWVKNNVIGLHKKIQKSLYLIKNDELSLTIQTKDNKDIFVTAYVDYNLSYEDSSVYESRNAFWLNNRQTLTSITCMDEDCSESSVVLLDKETGKKFATLYSGAESYNTLTKDQPSETQVDFIDIITKKDVITIERAQKSIPKLETTTEDVEIEEKEALSPLAPLPTIKPSQDVTSEEDAPKVTHEDTNDVISDDAFKEITKQAPKEPKNLTNNFIWPIDASPIKTNSPFGFRKLSIIKNGKPVLIDDNHKGMDFAYPRGTPVISIGHGIVESSNSKLKGFGNQVTVKYIDSINPKIIYFAVYAHLKELSSLKKGDEVKMGQKIGEVGNSGLNKESADKGNHLHLTVYKDKLSSKSKINPMEILNYRSDLVCSSSQHKSKCDSYHDNHDHDHDLSS